MTIYVVRPGDTLGGIAQHFGTTVEELARENVIPNPDLISAGQELRIPQRDGQVEGQDGQIEGVSLEQLRAIMPNLDEGWARDYLPYLKNTMDKFEINTPLRAAAFFGNIAYESGELTTWREVGGGSMWYAPYYGRGPIQLTGEANYDLCGQYLGIDLLSEPDRVASDTQVGFDSAGWFWRRGNGDLNVFADQGDFWTCYLRVLGSDNGTYDRRRSYYDKALEVLPETVEGAELMTEHKEVTLRVGDKGWLYRENADPMEWAKAPDLKNAKLTTDYEGWVYAESIWVSGKTELVEAGSLAENIEKVTSYNLTLVEQGIPYHLWQDGELINWDGPPAFGVDGPAPAPDRVNEIFCAGVGNLDLRLVGKPVPKNPDNPGYDGGTRAWDLTYEGYWIDFDLDQAEEGDIAFRPFQYQGIVHEQGHWVYVGPDRGFGNICIQSFPFYPSGEHGGMNASYTLEQSHDNGYYIKLLKAKDWLG